MITKTINKFNITNLSTITLIGVNHINLTRSFHIGNVLKANESHVPLNDVTKEDLLNGLNEIRVDSDQMSLSEFMSENFSTFDEAFPHYYDNLPQSETSVKMREAVKSVEGVEDVVPLTGQDINNSAPFLIKRFNSILYGPQPELPSNVSMFSFLNIKQDIENGKFNHILNRLHLQIKGSNDTTNIAQASPVLSFIRYDKGVFSVDFNNINQFFSDSVRYLYDHRSEIGDHFSGYLLPTVGSYFLYKKVVQLHSAVAFKDNITLLSLSPQADIIKARGKQTLFFNSVGALAVVVSLYGISNVMFSHLKNKHGFKLILFSSGKGEGSSSAMALFALFKKIKGPNWLKYLITFVLGLIFLILLYLYSPTILPYYLSINLFWIKVIGSLGCFFVICYNLLSLHILLKFSVMDDKDITIPQFIPNFIRNYLLDLKRISKYEYNVLNIFINIYVRGIFFHFVILLLFLAYINYIC
uniref:hypothetical protein n=1 Tax=Porodaedalea chrysoloma TaxID=74615 RepID=UPI0023AA71FE|nr:hypothetical protein P1S03_mgp15 [Porodaedalea chrysoloma]WCF76791.1 hypothetical protein [Porodaedalea chrysoloma]